MVSFIGATDWMAYWTTSCIALAISTKAAHTYAIPACIDTPKVQLHKP